MEELYLVTGEVCTVIPGRTTEEIKTRLVRADDEEMAEVKFRNHFSKSDHLVQIFNVEVSGVIE